MEIKRLVIVAMMMIMVALGNLVSQVEAQDSPFRSCYPSCIVSCAIQKKFPSAFMCPLTCIMTCLAPPTPIPSPPSQIILANENYQTDYFCKLGCATHHCVSVSSLQNPNPSKFIFLINIFH
ncbi:unnamed protein product [Thlaspi arvense]|uniref:Thionin-like protein 2 n=1 Tax=Thlaspi arvense TaxID=13288 RepID=A0AAU9SVD4_THLAR|nr:unnamed protein product [Thlaspi arvense]